MKRIITLALLTITSLGGYAQMRSYEQFSLEADYGLSGTTHEQTLTNVGHFGIGARYMFDEFWGAKFDYANDRFKLDADGDSGTVSNRFSLQGVYNLGRLLDIPWNTNDKVNLLAHAGLGYTSLQSKVNTGIDNIGHLIIGLTPQVSISESISLHFDASYIYNISQHYNFNGQYPAENQNYTGGDVPSFNASMFSVSAGLTIYLSREKNSVDFR